MIAQGLTSDCSARTWQLVHWDGQKKGLSLSSKEKEKCCRAIYLLKRNHFNDFLDLMRDEEEMGKPE